MGSIVDVCTDQALTTPGWNGAGSSGKTPVAYDVVDVFSIGKVYVTVVSQPTDRIPTHVRAVGEEISDYIDHALAQEYGLTFFSANTPWLDEAAAYIEAGRISEDALSYAEVRIVTGAAQLGWEPEDKVYLLFKPYDGGPEVFGAFIVDTISFSSGIANLQMTATLRRLYE